MKAALDESTRVVGDGRRWSGPSEAAEDGRRAEGQAGSGPGTTSRGPIKSAVVGGRGPRPKRNREKPNKAGAEQQKQAVREEGTRRGETRPGAEEPRGRRVQDWPQPVQGATEHPGATKPSRPDASERTGSARPSAQNPKATNAGSQKWEAKEEGHKEKEPKATQEASQKTRSQATPRHPAPRQVDALISSLQPGPKCSVRLSIVYFQVPVCVRFGFIQVWSFVVLKCSAG